MGEPMSEKAGPDTGCFPATAAARQAVDDVIEAAAERTSIAPDHETPPKPDAPKIEAPKDEPTHIEVPKLGAAPETEPEAESKPGQLIVMVPRERSSSRSWDNEDIASHLKSDEAHAASGKRRLAAVMALAACIGAISGALATAGTLQFAAKQAPAPMIDNSVLEASVARIEADLLALKAGLENSSKTNLGRFNQASDRIDKLEKAQTEPMVKLAKLSEAFDKLRTAQAAVPAPPAAAQAVASQATGPKVETGRVPTVDGWRLRDVANGGALIEGRGGIYEVYAGDPVPGLGRIDAIRRQDGRWVVVTSKGLIVAP